MNLKPIKSDSDHELALRRVEQLWEAPDGSPDADELDILATLIEAYENVRYPIASQALFRPSANKSKRHAT